MSGDGVYSSVLLNLEIIRVLRREGLDLKLARPVIDRVNLVNIDDGVVLFAAAFERYLRSLDAIHLATCALLGSGFTLITHDQNMLDVATGLGLIALDPLF